MFKDIHLNIKNASGLSPLMVAAKNGHIECVRHLLSAELPCKLGLTLRSEDDNTALTFAARHCHWEVVNTILQALPYIDMDQPNIALLCAAKHKQWDIFETVHKKNVFFKPNEWLKLMEPSLLQKDWNSLSRLMKYRKSHWVERETLLKLIVKEEWDGLSYLLASKDFEDQLYDDLLRKLVDEGHWSGVRFMLEKHNYEAHSIQYNLAETSMKGKWTGVEIFLNKVNPRAKLDIKFIETVLECSESKVKDIIYKGGCDYEILNGTLLVSACRGAEENMINLLLEHFTGYDYETLECLLFMTVLKGLVKVLTLLLHHHWDTLPFDVLCEAQALAKRLSRKNIVQILASVIEQHSTAQSNTFSVQDEGRGIGQGGGTFSTSRFQSKKQGPMQFSIRRAPMEEQTEGDVYKVNSTPRGMVLILNYHKFKDRSDLQRDGSQFDVINLMNLFSQMGYETQVHWDLTEDQTMHTISHFANQPRLLEADCSIIFIMSHGVARQTFYTSDMQCTTVDKIQSMFLDSTSPNLKGKPKMFFYNFCRGIDKPQMTVQSEGVREVPRDMICIYSAPEGFVSYRYVEAGTPFITCLCQVISTHACDNNLDDLLRKFKKAYSNAGHGSTPDIQDLNFRKKFYFNPR